MYVSLNELTHSSPHTTGSEHACFPIGQIANIVISCDINIGGVYENLKNPR